MTGSSNGLRRKIYSGPASRRGKPGETAQSSPGAAQKSDSGKRAAQGSYRNRTGVAPVGFEANGRYGVT